MAEVNTATSSHLNSYMHVYDNGTKARLFVTPWDRGTVADGYWQTVNTIQPLINRDIYLADALDKLANKYTVYSAGYGIIMNHNGVEDYYTISVNVDELANVPKYSFDTNYFNKEQQEDGSFKITMKFNSNSYITADSNGIYCNVNKMMSSTSSLSSYSSVSSNTISAFSYDYNVSQIEIRAVENLPTSPESNVNMYFVG